MTRPYEKLEVDRHYLRTLEGLFRPLLSSVHSTSMARLAVSTYINGLSSVDEEVNHYEYNPPWADKVKVRVLTRPRGTRESLAGVSLAIGDGFNCLDLDYPPENGERKLFIRHRNEENDSYFPSDTEAYHIDGPDKELVRQRVTQYASYVFLRATANNI